MHPLTRACAWWCLGCVLVIVSGCDQVTVREQTTPSVNAEGLERSVRALILAEGLETAWTKRLAGGLSIDAPASSVNMMARTAIQLGPVLQTIPVSRFESIPKQELTTVLMYFDSLQMVVPVRFDVGGNTVICRWQIGASNVISSVDLAVVEGSEGYNLEPIALPVTQLATQRVDAVGSCPVQLDEQPGANPNVMTRADFEAALADYARRAISESVDVLLSTSSLELVGLIDSEFEFSQPQSLPGKRGIARLAGTLSRPDPPPLIVSGGGLQASLDYALSFEPAACAPLRELDVITDEIKPPALLPAEVRAVNADMGLSISQPLIERFLQTLTRAGFLCSGLERIGTATESLSLRDVDFASLGIEDALFGDRIQYSVSPGALPRVNLNTTLGTVDITLESLQVELYAELFGTSVLAARVTFPITLSLKIVPDVAGLMTLRLDAVTLGEVALESEWLASSDEPAQTVIRDWSRRVVVLIFGERIQVPLPLRSDASTTLLEARVRRGDVVFFLSL